MVVGVATGQEQMATDNSVLMPQKTTELWGCQCFRSREVEHWKTEQSRNAARRDDARI